METKVKSDEVSSTPETEVRKISKKKQALFLLLIFFVFLILLEGVLRIIKVPPTLRQDDGMIKRLDNAINMEYTPNWNGYSAGVKVRINSAGWRGKEFATPKPAGIVRIIGLGDSYTFGKAIKEEETYLMQLENLLNQEGGKPFETINTGHDGTNTFQEFRYFKEREMLNLSPDVVVLGFTVPNDTEVAFYDLRFMLRNRLRDKSFLLDMTESSGFRSFAQNCHIAQILQKGANWANKDLITDESIKLKVKSYNEKFEAWQSCRDSLLGFYTLLREKKVPLIVVLLPDWTRDDNQTFRDYPEEFKEMHAQVSKVFANKDGVTVLDVIDELAATGLRSRDFMVPIDGHPNRLWHEVVARKLFTTIKGMKL